MNGYYDNEGHHRCSKNHLTQYQMFSGGKEFYCPICEYVARYLEGGNLRAHLFRTENGRKELKKQLKKEIKKRNVKK